MHKEHTEGRNRGGWSNRSLIKALIQAFVMEIAAVFELSTFASLGEPL